MYHNPIHIILVKLRIHYSDDRARVQKIWHFPKAENLMR
jgi:hypothetical protein